MHTTPTDLAATAAGMEDPLEALAAVAALGRLLESLEARHVEAAVRAGHSWADIAAARGVSRQAVHKKHAKRLGLGLRRGRSTPKEA